MNSREDLSVTVVIPVYNCETFVGEAIASVFDQTHYEVDLIIIDDGSTDESRSVIEETLSRYPERTSLFISRENRGVCRSLNEGLAKSEGKYFAYVGADDIWEPEKLSIQVAELERTGFAAAYSDCFVIDGKGNIVSRYGNQYAYKGGRIYEDIVWMRFQPASATVLFRREAVESAGGFNESQIWEDRDLWIRIARENQVVYIDQPLARYRVHGANGSLNNLDNMHRYSMQVLDATLERDPSLQKFRSRLEAKIDAFLACSQYEKLDLPNARRTAFKALTKYPFNYFAIRTLVFSCLGKSAISRVRSWRRLGTSESRD